MKLDDFIPDKDILVMCFEPASVITIEKARELFKHVKDESDLAPIYVDVENRNKSCWRNEDTLRYWSLS